MQQVAIYVIIFSLLFFLGFFFWFFLKFERLPIRIKSKSIESTAQSLRAGKESYLKERSEISREFDARLEAVRDKAIHTLLQAIPLSKLDEYPGIGPATVDKLRRAGYQDLPSLFQARLESISGFGEKRAGDIRGALRALHKDAVSRLDSGACPQSREIEPQKAKLQKEKEDRLGECDQVNQWRTETYQAMKETIERARQVAFIPWLFGHPLPDSLPDPPELTPPAYVPSKVKVATTTSTLPPSPPAPSVSHAPGPFAAEAPGPSPGRGEPGRSPSEMAYRTAPDEPVKTADTPILAGANSPWVAGDEMEIVARIGMAVGLAEGRFSEKEQLVLRRSLNEIYGGEAQKKNRIGSILAQCMSRKVDLEQVLAAARAQIPQARWPDLVVMAGQIADAGGKRGVQEAAVIAQIRASLTAPSSRSDTESERAESALKKIEPPAVPAHSQSVPPHSQQVPPAGEPPRGPALQVSARKNLEILESAPLTARLVRAQWKAMREKFDPVKFSGHGDEFTAMAQSRRQAADEAAKSLLQELGEAPTLDEPVKDLRHNPDLDAAFGL